MYYLFIIIIFIYYLLLTYCITVVFSSIQELYERGPKQACRLHGKLELNKVAGNFHVTAGKTLPLLRGHAHIAAL